MADNILLGPDAQVRFSLQMLRALEGRGAIAGGTTPIQDGIFLSCDPESGIKGEFEASKTNMVSVNIHPSEQGTPRWLGLHIAMGPVDLSNAAVVGIAARSKAPSSITTRVCLRSGRSGQFMDTFFPKTMVSFAAPSTHLDLLDLSALPDLPRQAAWRELVLFFRPGEVDLDLLDLRLFVV